MMYALLILNSLIFLLIALLHIYWAFGGTWAIDSAIPTNSDEKKMFSPGILGTLTVALGLLFFMLTDLTLVGFITFDIAKNIIHYLVPGIAIIFLIRALGDFNYVGFTKRHIQSKFAKMDTRFYSPLCLFIALSHFLAYWIL
uniref:DUF3995 domain-containing protein n=1 Tax=Pedobacter schmidteae TaxID=2201271 RepID=UPI000EB52397|nr:DUF3995 domain-containing protein [Pedobacter schmidteae]